MFYFKAWPSYILGHFFFDPIDVLAHFGVDAWPVGPAAAVAPARLKAKVQGSDPTKDFSFKVVQARG